MNLEEDHRNLVQRSAASLLVAYKRTFRPARKINGHRLFPDSVGVWVIVLLVLAIVTALVLFADADLLIAKQGVETDYPLVLRYFGYVTELGRSGWILVSVALVGLYLSIARWRALPRRDMWRKIQIYADMNFIFFTVAISGSAVWMIKNLIGRARPKHMAELGSTYFSPATFKADFASFPSGHATTFGCLFMALALLYPRLWPLWLASAVVGASSRVVIGAHYLSDAIMGAALGMGFAVLSARWLAQRGTMFVFNGSWMPRRKR